MEKSGMTACLSTAYLPPVQWFAKLIRYENVFVEQYENFQKQSYRNRCVIAGPNGPIALTVPIEKPDTLKCLTKDIRISDHGHWRHLHWNALESAYNQTPYFEYLKDDLRPFYEKPFHFLMDFNEELVALLCILMDIEPHIERTADYNAVWEGADFRDSIHPKRGYAEDADFTPVPYYQVFRQKLGFLPNLSIVDLLFNMGPESVLVLNRV